MAGLNRCRTRAGVMPNHPRLQEAREGMATKKHHCSRAACSHHQPHCYPAVSALGLGQGTVLPQAASSAPCPGRAVPTRAWDTLGPSPCRVGTYACTHQPSPFSALIKPNNLPEANFSHDAGQETRELHLPVAGRAGSITRT